MAQPVASHLWCSKFKLYFKMSLGAMKFSLIETKANKQNQQKGTLEDLFIPFLNNFFPKVILPQ